MSTPKAKPRLGRGLSSLISVSDLPVEPASVAATEAVIHQTSAPEKADAAAPSGQTVGSPLEVAVESIHPNPHQPRKAFDETSIQALANSLKSSGLVQPIVVRRVMTNQGDHYELIAGERRLRAAKVAGLRTVPVLIRDVDAFTQAQMALVENVQREDLNPIDRAQAYRSLISQLGLTQGELATRIGEDRSSIANYLRLLELTPDVQSMVHDGRLTLGHAKILAGIADPIRQKELADRVVGQALSVRNLERLVQEQPPVAPPQKPNASAHLKDLEQNLTSQLGLRVQLRAAGKKGKGRLVIHYGSLDQFDALLERMGCKSE
jgi:ParB family transcriptional regulator, chromosome partitioning protein